MNEPHRKSALVRTCLGPLVALSLLGFMAAGCASAHPPAAPRSTPIADVRAVARSIVLCQTTEAELRQKLGEPSRDGIVHDVHVESWLISTETLTRYLAVRLDAKGVVVDLYWDVPTEIPWVPTDLCQGR